MSSLAVLDASVVLAFLQGETLNDLGRAAIRPGAKISAVNLCEVLGKLVDRGVDLASASIAVGKLQLDVEAFDQDAARRAASFRATMPKHISLADRACLALAEARTLQAFTCDREWLNLGAACAVTIAR